MEGVVANALECPRIVSNHVPLWSPYPVHGEATGGNVGGQFAVPLGGSKAGVTALELVP